MNDALALVIGYLLGAVLPAYFIGRARGIDLRTTGDGNPGATNAVQTLGRGPGYLTAVYDMLKGPVAVAVGFALGAGEWAAYGAGIAAFLGHRFPFYLGFKGGRGFATASGLLIFGIGYAAVRGFLPLLDVVLFLGLFLVLWWVFGGRAVPDTVVLPLAVLDLVARRVPLEFLVPTGIVIAYVWIYNITRVRREKLFRLRPETRAALGDVRVLMRPAALAFPVLYLFLPRSFLLSLVGAVALFFVSVDISRLLWRRFNLALFRRMAFFYRPNEEHTFTSASLFLLGTLLTILLFPKPVATTALIFVTFGDLSAKIAGLERGRHRLFTRSVEGSLTFFAVCVAAGFGWSFLVPIAPSQYILGAFVGAITEALPLDLNDNFTVPLMSGAAMMLPALLGIT
ncbi:MAG: glycerol-3-phosphate acyltransferase [Anaerosomatales bacterium]|nr:glycerol-3-phosphate acyltransferase [Anaerosomatales bacterium]